MSFRKVAEPEDKPSVAGPRLCEESESRVAPLPSDASTGFAPEFRAATRKSAF